MGAPGETGSEYEPRQISVLGQFPHTGIDVGCVDRDGLAAAVAGGEADLFDDLLQHRLETSGADVFQRAVHGFGRVGEGVDGVFAEGEGDALGGEQCLVLAYQVRLRLGEDAPQIVAGERLEFDPYRQAALEFGKKIRRLGDMESARGDE